MKVPERLAFPLALIGIGAALVLTPLLAHVYTTSKRDNRIFQLRKEHGASLLIPDELKRAWANDFFLFFMMGVFTGAVGVALILIGLWWARKAQKLGNGATEHGGESASRALGATTSFSG
jgi:hypothetical protein